MTTVGEGRAAARRWVAARAASAPGFTGAFHTGSTCWLPADAVLPVASDVDVVVVVDTLRPPPRLGKTLHDGVLLDVSYCTAARVASAAAVLGDPHLAPSFSTPNVITDASGRLAALQAAVAEGYPRRRWVRRRCARVHALARQRLHALLPDQPLVDQVLAWMLAAGVPPHLLLVAGLRDPTVRRRYVDVRDLLEAHGRLDVHEALLGLLGAAAMTPGDVARHVVPLAAAFDAAAAVSHAASPSWAVDIRAGARPVVVDGSDGLIATGLHREAVFWMVVTYAKCQKVLGEVDPASRRHHDAGFADLLADLGIAGPADIAQRCAGVARQLPAVWDLACAIIDADPRITG